MKYPTLLVALILSTSASGCSDDSADQSLIASTLVGDFEGTAFTPKFGVASVVDGGIELYLNTVGSACEDDGETHDLDGLYVVTGAELPGVGTDPAANFLFTRVTDGALAAGGGSDAGTVTITAVTDDQVTATLSYDGTDGTTMKHYALQGNVTLHRCP